MGERQQDLNARIKTEADTILYERGLLASLRSFGTPHVHGSYLLDLMTWRDLDIYVQVDTISTGDFFALGERICDLLSPVKMHFRNEVKAKTKGLPEGLYWGVYFGDERAGAWKIDIWSVRLAECQRLLAYCSSIREKLTAEAVQRILAIKTACWQDAAFRRTYSSADIYTAVLDHAITNIDEFKGYLSGLNPGR